MAEHATLHKETRSQRTLFRLLDWLNGLPTKRAARIVVAAIITSAVIMLGVIAALLEQANRLWGS